VAGDTPALKQAVASGMCVGVGYSNITPSDPITPGIKTYFGYNDQLGGRNLAAAIAKKMGGKGGLVYIGGTEVGRERAAKARLPPFSGGLHGGGPGTLRP
jgi:ABC-type sugar transport system substrate-binding protein